MLLVHQLGPGPRPPLQLLDGEWRTLPQAPPHDYSSLRAFWSCTRLGWPIHLARDFPYQRCLLVGLDIPPLVIASGTRWAPQDFDINLFYRTHLSAYFGERRWRDSGLVYGDLYVMFDRAIDSTARRPWLVAAETFVDVILGAADGSDLGNWPCPSGWSVRPVHTLGPIGHAALQRSSAPLPILFHTDPPGGPLVEVSSDSSESVIADAVADSPVHVTVPSPRDSTATDARSILLMLWTNSWRKKALLRRMGTRPSVPSSSRLQRVSWMLPFPPGHPSFLPAVPTAGVSQAFRLLIAWRFGMTGASPPSLCLTTHLPRLLCKPLLGLGSA